MFFWFPFILPSCLATMGEISTKSNHKNQNIFIRLLLSSLNDGPRSPKLIELDGYLICLRKRIGEHSGTRCCSRGMEAGRGNINLCTRWTGKFFDIKNRFSSSETEPSGGGSETVVSSDDFPMLRSSQSFSACHNRILGETENFIYLLLASSRKFSVYEKYFPHRLWK